jgi:Fur family ferric uptake transcriptional regulator
MARSPGEELTSREVTARRRRNTPQRATLLDLLSATDEFVSAGELHRMLRTEGSTIGLATVYRALQDLSTSGDVDSVRSGDSGEFLYRRCRQPTHHHHLVCRVCGRTQEISGTAVERWVKAVADQYGYTEVDHQMELFGVCAECRTAEPDTRS